MKKIYVIRFRYKTCEPEFHTTYTDSEEQYKGVCELLKANSDVYDYYHYEVEDDRFITVDEMKEWIEEHKQVYGNKGEMTDFDYKHIPAKKQAEIYCKAREVAESSNETFSLEQITEKFGYKGDEAKLFLLQYQGIKK